MESAFLLSVLDCVVLATDMRPLERPRKAESAEYFTS